MSEIVSETTMEFRSGSMAEVWAQEDRFLNAVVRHFIL
jgi:hypothetical protein